MTTAKPLCVTEIEALAEQLEYIVLDVERVVDALKQTDLVGTVSTYHHLKKAYDRLDKARKSVYGHLNHLDKTKIPAAFEEAGVDMVRVPELERSFYPLTKYSASMPDKIVGMEWLREHGGEELIQETVNASSLTAFIKSMILDEGVEPPEEAIKFNSYKITGSSTYTPK
jgi:hypothetical protein